MGVENIVAGNGFGLAVVGMSVVFAGLLLVSLYVGLLPRILQRLERRGRPETPRRGSDDHGMAKAAGAAAGGDATAFPPHLLVAIGYVFQAERERQLALDHQEITLRDDDEQRVWTAIGKMRTLSKRM